MTIPVYDINGQDFLALSKGLGHYLPERWKRYNSTYAVSDWGRVAKLSTKRLVKQFPNAKGYASIAQGYRTWPLKVHKMILPTFYPRHEYSPNAHESYPMIDHINQNRMDASLENLRYSNVKLNGLNKKATKGYSIVRYNGKPTGRFRSGIQMDGRKVRFGTFTTKESAAARYFEALRDAFTVLEY